MKGRMLRRLRVIVALLVLVWSLVLFLDLHQVIPESVFEPLRYLQLVPAVQLAISLVTGGLIALVLLAALGFLFGRAYCSFLCPLGILQDVIGRIRNRFRKKARYRKQPSYTAWRYSFLALFLLALLAGSGVVVGILDPYSWFGRISASLFKPVLLMGNNLLAWTLNSMGSFALSPVKSHGISWASMGISAGMLAFIFILVWKNGRIYCNTVCPAGTLFGLAGSRALYRIRFKAEACTSCGLCAIACKAGCIDVKTQSVDHSRCVVCFNCLPACSEGGMAFRRAASRSTDLGRREMLVRAGSTIILPAVLKEASAGDKAKAIRRSPISPPGSISHTNLHLKCTACHLCISACPSGVLQPSLTEYGLQGVFQPMIDPMAGYCNYDCIRCLEVCPTGAISPMTVEDKKMVQTGRTRFIEELCVVTKDNTACGACSEHCPTKAVNMIPWKGTLNIPNVDNSICVGCGACEYACPTTPRSIVVDGNPIHRKAETPRNTGDKAEEVVLEEFPF